MEEVKCQVCGNSLMQAFGGFFHTSTGFLCKGDYENQPDEYEIYYDLFEDFVIQSLSDVERSLRKSHEQVTIAINARALEIKSLFFHRNQTFPEKTYCPYQPAVPREPLEVEDNWSCWQCGASNFASSQICCHCCASKNREHEPTTDDFGCLTALRTITSAASESEPPPEKEKTYCSHQPAVPMELQELEDNWSCWYCDNSNFASNPICYHCRASKNGEYGPVTASAAADFDSLTIMQTLAATSGTSKWTCIRCQRSNPMSNSKCDCGYVNLALINTSDQEEKSEPLPQPFSQQPAIQSMCWACPCGYEYNLNTTNHCEKCNYEKLEASPQLPDEPAPRYTLPAKPRGSTMCWECSCGYEYNLNTSDTCLKCKSEKPGTKPPQSEDFKSASVQHSEDVWKCKCGKENSGTEVCKICPRRNPDLPPESVYSRCNMKKSARADRMSEGCAAKTVKAGRSPQYWTCKPCNNQKIEIGKPCNRCLKMPFISCNPSGHQSVRVKSANPSMKAVKDIVKFLKSQVSVRQPAPPKRPSIDFSQHRAHDKRKMKGGSK